jgi:peptidoglycan/xylan/chitin deacetylase (PgdA/CDA1 family)
MTEPNGFWPGGARLAVSVSMQFEAGGQPISGASGPITEPILDGFPDLGQNTFYEYGAREGVPRLLDLMDAHGITMTSFMIGDAVRRHPQMAAELYAEGAVRCRMMVIGLHERISGHASRVRVLDRILTRLREHPDVWWARKDQIAQWVLDHPDTAAWVDRDPAPVSGLPGRST